MGFEQPPDSPEKTAIPEAGDAESDAFGAGNALDDPELARLVTLWPTLSADARQAILAIAERAGTGE
ncbi:hypothetical protein Mal4_35570 [Maioricimonas rarisocia]|uniref:Uncharacterized protein n=1 Tax=Maioricimonas rarisocia TaxID=2528026 RepID=A0A517Z9V9_9PLAN|nr:hypothetical protein [Maioricimonas rarisocia]QDU39220.1 hypothetical protein Mal4_35570 [Maioricimonas rarisocia]